MEKNREEQSQQQAEEKSQLQPTAGKANQRTANRDKAKYEEKHSTKESCSQPVPDVQQGHELKLGEVITTINFDEETVENKENHPDNSEAATQKIPKIVMDSLSLKQKIDEVSSAGNGISASQLLEQMPSPLNIPIPGIDQYHNSRITGSATIQEWGTTQNGCKCAVHCG